MQILYLDPFHGGSHAAVAEGYARHSQHDITLLTLSIAGGWRWRMRGAAVVRATWRSHGSTTPAHWRPTQSASTPISTAVHSWKRCPHCWAASTITKSWI